MWGQMRSLCIEDVNICGDVKNLWGCKKYVGTNEGFMYWRCKLCGVVKILWGQMRTVYYIRNQLL